MKSYEYRDLRRRTRQLRGMLFVLAGISMARLLAFHYQRDVLNSVPAMTEETRSAIVAAANGSDLVILWLARLVTAMLLATYVVGGMWLYRATANLYARGARRLSITPGWAVGWYAVPFACLLMPFRSMKEIWHASLNARDWDADQQAAVLPIWWTLWLGAGFLSMLSASLAKDANDLAAILRANMALQVADVVHLAACLLFAYLVGEVYARQELQFGPPAVSELALDPA